MTKILLFLILLFYFLCSCNRTDIKNIQKNDVSYEVIINDVYRYEEETYFFYLNFSNEFQDSLKIKYISQNEKLKDTLSKAISLCTRCYELLKKASEDEREKTKFSYSKWNKSYSKRKVEYLLFLQKNVKWRHYCNRENFERRFQNLICNSKIAYIPQIKQDDQRNNIQLLEQEKINIAILLLETKGALYYFEKIITP